MRARCWGASRGLAALEETLWRRKATAPAKSYTKRLFEDPVLLRRKPGAARARVHTNRRHEEQTSGGSERESNPPRQPQGCRQRC